MSGPIRAVVTDIEGTTTPVSFVTETLFPFARARMADFLTAHGDEPEIADLIEEAAYLASVPHLTPSEAVAVFLGWMDEDRKLTPLKTVQGLIWTRGYEDGALTGELYPDVAPRLAEWHAEGKRLHVYSSGSEQAQKLLFGHTAAGDLTPLFDGFFDTRIGAKTAPRSYAAIVERVQIHPTEILFLSDTEAELDAAAVVGFATARLARDGAVESRHPVHRDFGTILRAG